MNALTLECLGANLGPQAYSCQE